MSSIPDEIKMQMKAETNKGDPIPDEVKVESVALNNNPYTPEQQNPVKKEEVLEKEQVKQVVE